MQIHKITDSGIKFKQLYKVSSFPFIAIIDPRTGNCGSSQMLVNIKYGIDCCILYVGEKMASWNSLEVKEFMRLIPEFLASHPFSEADDDHGHATDGERNKVNNNHAVDC